MKEQKLYICDYCGTQYEEKARCAKCEKTHAKISKIRDVEYHADGKYPDRVEVVFEDGSFAYYKQQRGTNNESKKNN